jgi:hypothetical protein
MARFRFNKNIVLMIILILLISASGCTEDGADDDDNNDNVDDETSYDVHRNIKVTLFWIGEEPNENNGWISNSASGWDDKWLEHYGGVDDPSKRNGYEPANFTPTENPFYVALPYSDFDDEGMRRPDALEIIPWADEKTWGAQESLCKNRWLKITKNGNIAYAQWEDVGPYIMDDSDYVFGNATPENDKYDEAGIDVSPAVRDYLGLALWDEVDWEFVDFEDVPDGPWKKIITTSQVYWL